MQTILRSKIMASVPQRNTKPEMLVRSALHEMGYRFRLHRSDLPGTPDIVLPKHRTVIFVHGCFWHRHLECKKTTTPKQNAAFWQAKFERNLERDADVTQSLVAKGWRVLVIWQCEAETTKEQLVRHLGALLESS